MRKLSHPCHGETYPPANVVSLVPVGCKYRAQVFKLEHVFELGSLAAYFVFRLLPFLQLVLPYFLLGFGAGEALRFLLDHSAVALVSFHSPWTLARLVAVLASFAGPLVIVKVVLF